MSEIKSLDVVLFYRVDNNVKVTYNLIANEYKTMKSIVGGALEGVSIGQYKNRSVYLVCNDNGKNEDLKPSLYLYGFGYDDFISGNCFIVLNDKIKGFQSVDTFLYDKLIENMTHNNFTYYDNDCRVPCLDLVWLGSQL